MTDGNGEDPVKPTFRGLRPTRGETKAEADARKYVDKQRPGRTPAPTSAEIAEDYINAGEPPEYRQLEQMERLIQEVRSIKGFLYFVFLLNVIGAVLLVAPWSS